MKKNKIDYLKTVLALILIGAFYLLIGCPIRVLTGIPCPGCGMTRAYFSLLRLDFAGACHYHPLWPIPIVFMFLFFFVKNRNRRLYDISIYVFAVIFIIVYVYRLSVHDQIVNIALKDGILYKIYQFLQK